LEVTDAQLCPEPGTEVLQDDESSPCGMGGNQEQVVERGKLTYPGAATFWVQAECFPLWSLALDRSYVHALYLVRGLDAKSYLQAMRDR
jgi:hypothetical protein